MKRSQCQITEVGTNSPAILGLMLEHHVPISDGRLKATSDHVYLQVEYEEDSLPPWDFKLIGGTRKIGRNKYEPIVIDQGVVSNLYYDLLRSKMTYQVRGGLGEYEILFNCGVM